MKLLEHWVSWARREPAGVKVDVNETRRKAEQGNLLAQYELAMMCKNGREVPRDYSEAFHWFHEAARQGYAPAQAQLGIMYAKGMGVAVQYMESYKWLSLAAVQGDKHAIDYRDVITRFMSLDEVDQARRQAAERLASASSDRPRL